MPWGLGSVHICALKLGIACITPHRLQACNLLRGVEPALHFIGIRVHLSLSMSATQPGTTTGDSPTTVYRGWSHAIFCPIGLRAQPCEAFG